MEIKNNKEEKRKSPQPTSQGATDALPCQYQTARRSGTEPCIWHIFEDTALSRRMPLQKLSVIYCFTSPFVLLLCGHQIAKDKCKYRLVSDGWHCGRMAFPFNAPLFKVNQSHFPKNFRVCSSALLQES